MLSNRKSIFQSLQFIMLSGIGWVVDFSIFTYLVKQLNWEVFESNCLSSFVAITLVFFVSTKSIFKNNSSNIALKYKYLVYILYQLVLIVGISWLANLINHYVSLNFDTFEWIINYSELLTKLVITPITMFLNFVVMKFLIEKL